MSRVPRGIGFGVLTALVIALAAALGWLSWGAGERPAGDAAAADSAPAYATRPLAGDPLWDDGNAEFSIYSGIHPRYGADRPVTAYVIVVKEDMNTMLRVKSDPGPVPGRTEEVLKVNYLHDFQTGVYAYHQMSSVFYRRRDGALRKLAMSSTEGCGITYVEVLPGQRGWRHVSHSYWDGESDRDFTIRAPEGETFVAWDGLYYWLRTLDLDHPQRFRIRLLPSQLSSRVTATQFVDAAVEVGAAADGTVPLDVTYAAGPGEPPVTDRFRYRAAWPHVLESLATHDGVTFKLVRTMRIPYWEKHNPGDEALLAPDPAARD